MHRCNQLPDTLPKMQEEISLTLRWCSFSRCGRECITFFWLWRRPVPQFWMMASNCMLDYQDPTPKLFGTPLMFIFRMRQGACQYYFGLRRQRIHRLWMAATNRHLHYTRCTATNHRPSVDTYFQSGAVTVSFTLLPEKPASMLVMNSSHQVTLQLPYLQD